MYFEGVQFGSHTNVKLYRVGEFAVVNVNVDGKDALNSKATIRTNAKNKDGSVANITFSSKIYGEVSKIDIVQNDKALTANSRKVNSSEYIYTNTYTASDFTDGDSVYMYVTLKSGKVEKTKLNINSLRVFTDDISVKLPEKVHCSSAILLLIGSTVYRSILSSQINSDFLMNITDLKVQLPLVSTLTLKRNLKTEISKRKIRPKRMTQAIIRTMRALKDTQHSPK